MLILVTATHTEDNCPSYNPELVARLLPALEKREEIAKRHHVQLLGFWSAAPDHVRYILLEADSSLDVDLFLSEVAPFRQAFRLTPLMTADELVELGKAAMARPPELR